MTVRTLAVGLALAAAAASPVAAQQRVHRFVVDSVGDSTFVFRVPATVGWLRAGHTGITVDPRQRDALVARFRVLNVGERRATALVTGQTAFITRDHIALVEEPPSRFFREGTFWAGSLLGAVLGAVGALLLTR